MAIIQAQRYCRLCNMRTLHVRTTLGSGWGCLLTVLTVGLFLPVWLLIGIGEALVTKWHCQNCGRGRRI